MLLSVLSCARQEFELGGGERYHAESSLSYQWRIRE